MWVWDAATVAATTSGSLVALFIATRGWKERQNELNAEHLSEARLIRVGGPPGTRPITPIDPDEGPTHQLVWKLSNVGKSPVFDVYFEAWPSGADEPWAIRQEIFMPDKRPSEYVINGRPPRPGELQLSAWQIRWTDRHGIQWRVDSATDRVPRRYDGTPPRRYGG